MNINEKINLNNKESVFIMVFKNRRWDDWNGWIYDEVQHHTINKDRLAIALRKLNENGYYEVNKNIVHNF